MTQLKKIGNVGAFLFIIATGTTASAVDITGTWSGKEKCKCFNSVDGKVTERFKDEEMRITQSGTDLNILAFEELFNGNVINHPQKDKRGEAAFVACNTNPNDNGSFGEIGRAKLSTQNNGNGKFEAESLWNSSQTEICKCKWHFKRTDTEDPSIADCA